MSEIKHTPGPWWASGLEVGTVPMMDIKVARVSGATFDEAKANARLIAATPDMLEALRLAAKFCGGLTSDECPDAVAVTIRNAIAKATGGRS